MGVLVRAEASLWRILVPVVCLVAGIGFAASARDSNGTELRAPGTASLADTVAAWQRAHPAALAALRIDLPVAAEEFAHLGALAKLAMSFGGGADSAQVIARITAASRALNALGPLGTVECIAIGDESGVTELRVGTKRSRN